MSPKARKARAIGALPAESNDGQRKDGPFFIQKESGPLYPDLVVQLNTSELRGFDPLECGRQSTRRLNSHH